MNENVLFQYFEEVSVFFETFMPGLHKDITR